MHSCRNRENSLEGLKSRKEFEGERQDTAQASSVSANAGDVDSQQGPGPQRPYEQAATAATGEADLNGDEHWKLLWSAQVSQLYHARRCAFYERLAKTSDFFSIMGASTALTAIGSYFPKWAGALGAFVALAASALVLVVGASSMARRHDELRRRFCELEGKLQEDTDAGVVKLGRWRRERTIIEMDEPPTYWALNVLCEKERARGSEKADPKNYQLPWYKSLTANLFLWRNS